MCKQSRCLKGLTIEAPQTAEETLVVFPLTSQNFNGRGYLTEEAIQQGLVFISESGRVPEVKIVVKGEKTSLRASQETIAEREVGKFQKP